METEKTKLERSGCPVSYSLDLLGDKWTLLILRDMMLFGKKTYSEFLASEEKIATNIANDRLKKLIENGFIRRNSSTAKRWNIPYALTEKAIDLLPIVLDLVVWGSKYGPSGNLEKLINKVEKNRKKTINELRMQLLEN